VGATDGNSTAVEGVEPGETIAGDNFNRLQEGMKVAIRSSAAEPKQGGHRKTKADAGGDSGS
jgi:hypothetical protein